jgi:hypothetical protein
MSNLIGLTGFKQTGKSTAAKHLENKGFIRLNFKDALLEEIKLNFPDLLREIKQWMADEVGEYGPFESWTEIVGKDYFTMEDITDEHLFIIKPPLMRALLQNYGTEVRRRDNPNYWVNRWKARAQHLIEQGQNVVVDDVRFLNEANAVMALGGTVIRITRPDITTGGTHASEQEMLQIEVDLIINTKQGDFDSLYNYIDGIVDNSNQ